MADILIAPMDEDTHKGSPNYGPVWIDDLVGYWFTLSSTSQNIRVYKTDDGGATWSLLTTIDSINGDLLRFAMWFDQWTTGEIGTTIHMTWQGETTPGTTRDGLWYAQFDTVSEATRNKQRIAEFSGESGGHFHTIGITKARGGALDIGLGSSGGLFFYRSVDGGATWVKKADFIENTSDRWIMQFGNETDAQDIWVAYLDVSDNEVSLKVYDDSGDSWAETSIDASGNVFTGNEDMTMAQASIRHADGHMILAFWSQHLNAAADLKIYDINGAGSITAKTDVETNFVNRGLGLTIVQNTDPATIYVFFGDASGGASSVDIFYRKSEDGGATWGASVQLNTTTRQFSDVSADWSIGADGGRIMAVFYDSLNDDAYTNFDLSVAHEPDIFDGFVDWQNNGDFDDAIDDITADIRMARGFTMTWDRGADKELGEAATGTLSFTVNNGDGKYSPENTGSSLSPNVLPYRPIRIRKRHLGVTYDLFKGFIEKYIPNPSPDQQSVDIFCVDGMDQLERRIIEAPAGGAQTDVKLGDDPGPVETVLDEAGWPVGDRNLDAGVDTLDVWWAHKESALAALRKLAKAEASFMYVDGTGDFVYEDRHHRLGDGGGGATDHLTSQANFSNNMSGMAYEFSARSVRNIINARGEKLTARSQAYVWETQDTPSLPATTGATLVVWADLPNPVTGLVEPVRNTDWKANTVADGSGDDESASVGIASVKYGQALQMTLTNNTSPAKKVFIIPGTSDPEHTLRIQAQEWESNPVFTAVEDSTSKTAFGERGLDIDIPFKGNFNDILSYAEYLLARKKDPQPDFIRMMVVNGSDALWTQILLRKLSDRITLTEDDLGISAQQYFINKMQHRVSEGGKRHEVIWSLARADEEAFWVLGKTGFSELGQTTILVF